MSSKGNAPRRSGQVKQFVKDWRRLAGSGRYDMEELKKVMRLLIGNAGPLPAEYHDHPLKGDWRDHRDCHIAGDWVLIYRVNRTQQGEEVIFVRTGTHAELFE
jgi:mRNA interferase YafQ